MCREHYILKRLKDSKDALKVTVDVDTEYVFVEYQVYLNDKLVCSIIEDFCYETNEQIDDMHYLDKPTSYFATSEKGLLYQDSSCRTVLRYDDAKGVFKEEDVSIWDESGDIYDLVKDVAVVNYDDFIADIEEAHTSVQGGVR